MRGYHLFRGLYQQRPSLTLISEMYCRSRGSLRHETLCPPTEALNNLHPGKIFYDSAYNLLGSKSTFTAHVFELMQPISLSLYYVTNQSAQGKGGSGKLISLQISIFSFLPKQPINDGQLINISF